MTATPFPEMRFTSLKQVEAAICRTRKFTGIFPFLSCRLVDGPGTTRLYFLSAYAQGPLTLKQVSRWRSCGIDYFSAQRLELRIDNIFRHTEAQCCVRTWIQGGLDREGVLQWANAMLPIAA
jgi:hypothetical protein